jgi:hypothetical protein
MKRLAQVTVIALAIGLIALAANRATVSPVNANEQRLDQKPPARRALLIGVGKYDSPRFPSLEYPHNDVARFSELLKSPKYDFQVTTLTDDSSSRPTRKNVLDAMQRYLVEEPNPGDTVVFYYSGHGSWVKNSLSDESDQRDETIVPSDAVRPVTNKAEFKDIRDKEIAEIFNRALDKKIKLTAIFDSCHSGSIARGGDEQKKEVDGVEFDFRERPTEAQKVKPEDRGALILTAAEDYQQAGGGRYELNGHEAKYSHLTAELLQSLYEVPAFRQSVRELFRRVMARIVGAGRTQTPTIAGNQARLDETLFGDAPQNTSGRTRVAITTIDDNGIKNMMLAGGLADGLADGVELRRIDQMTGKETVPPVKIRVQKAGLSVSGFDVIASPGVKPKKPEEIIKNGDLFEQSSWLTKKEPALSVWLPPATLSEKELAAVAKDFQAARANVEFLSEPSMDTPHNLVFADTVAGKTEWKIRLENGAIQPVGARLDATTAFRSITGTNSGKAKVFLDLPPSLEMRAALESSFRNGEGGVAIAATRDTAQYELFGRYIAASGSIQYAWVLRSGLTEVTNAAKRSVDDQTVSLPPITDWTDSNSLELSTSELKTMAMKLGKIRGWLRLPSPIAVESPEFPYRLEIRQRNGSRRRTLLPGDEMFPNAEYELVLTALPSALTNNRILPEFWAYVFHTDCNGNANYIGLGGTSDRYGGMPNFDPLNPPSEIILTPADVHLAISEPYGTDTFFLLITTSPIETGLFDFSGVRGQNASQRGEFNSLDNLLSRIGVDVTARGSTPDTWAVQRLIFRSSAQPFKTN